MTETTNTPYTVKHDRDHDEPHIRCPDGSSVPGAESTAQLLNALTAERDELKRERNQLLEQLRPYLKVTPERPPWQNQFGDGSPYQI